MRVKSLLLCTSSLAATPLLTCAGGEEVTFRFAPGDGTLVVQEAIVTKMTTAPEGTVIQVLSEKTEFRYAKTADGYTVSVKPLAFSVTRDGRAVEEPLLAALSGLSFTYKLDPQGKLLAIEGLEDAERALQENLPPKVAPLVSQFDFKRQMMVQRQAEWNERIGDLAGRTFELGSSWTSDSDPPLPMGGSASLTTTTTLAERVPCGDRSCVRIVYRYQSEPVDLGQELGKIAGDEAPRALGGLMKAEVTGRRERLVDPSTLLTHGETLQSTRKMRIAAPGQAEREVIQDEKQEVRFEFPPPSAAVQRP